VRAEVDARGVDAEQDAEADQEEVGELRDADAGRQRERVERHHAPLDRARHDARDDHEAGDHDDALDQGPQAERRLPGQQVDRVERRLDPVEPAEQRERDRDPDGERQPVLPAAQPAVLADQEPEQVEPEPHQQQRRGELQRGVEQPGVGAGRARDAPRHQQAEQSDDVGRQHQSGLEHPPLP
jgi:hypothetical protein